MKLYLKHIFLSVLPTITGTCDQNVFYITVKYGSQGHSFQTMVGSQQLTPDLGEVYKLQENGTHYSLVVPYIAKDTAFEVGQVKDLQTGLNPSALDDFTFCLAADHL